MLCDSWKKGSIIENFKSKTSKVEYGIPIPKQGSGVWIMLVYITNLNYNKNTKGVHDGYLANPNRLSQ